MNFSLMREVYGNNPWLVDSHTLPALLNTLQLAKSGVSLELPEQKYNSISFLNTKSNTLIYDDYDLRNKSFSEGIGIINLDGAITVGGGASSRGMLETSNMMLKMAKDSRIKGFMIYTNSGGGSSAAVEIMSDAINDVKKTKPVYSLIKKGGLAASAAYGIISATHKIYSESEMNFVGSVGTMIQFEGKKANSEDVDGVKNIRLYATKSTKKNIAYEEALNNDNYNLLVNDLLDPINENFIKLVESNRPLLKGTDFDNGHDRFAKDSIGTFIDGISNFDSVIQMILSDSNNNNSNINLINNSKKMNKEEFKNASPTAYAEIVSEGISSERERVGSWMAYAKADVNSVVEGIESGKEISSSIREKMMIKLNSTQSLENLTADSQSAIVTQETKTVVENVAPEVNKELESAFNFKL
jgi:ClpP class serine protease